MRRRDGVVAYQLAVVVDDADQGVTHVLRGDDLEPSTARQLALWRALELGPEPQLRTCSPPARAGRGAAGEAPRRGVGCGAARRRRDRRAPGGLARLDRGPWPDAPRRPADLVEDFALARLDRRAHASAAACSLNGSLDSDGRLAQLARAPALHAGGHRFEACTAHRAKRLGFDAFRRRRSSGSADGSSP